MKKSPTVSLVLGSGGARGLAHIGIIQYLNAHGFKIRSISGASMGALIGGIYAAGELDSYTHWVSALEKTDVLRLLDFSFSGEGLIKGDRVIGVLKDLIGERNIEDLPIAFTAVATDIQRQKEIWLNNGLLFDAIRASIAIPTIFTPHEYRGMTLLDGGLLNPIPIAPTLNDATDLTIVVNLSGKNDPLAGLQEKPQARAENSTLNNGNKYRQRIAQFIDDLQQKLVPRNASNLGMFELIGRSLDTLENTIGRMKLAAFSPDVIIEIPRNVCSFYEFHRARELIDTGYHIARANFEKDIPR